MHARVFKEMFCGPHHLRESRMLRVEGHFVTTRRSRHPRENTSTCAQPQSRSAGNNQVLFENNLIDSSVKTQTRLINPRQTSSPKSKAATKLRVKN